MNVGSVDNRYAAAVSPYGRRSIAAYRAGRAPHSHWGMSRPLAPLSPGSGVFLFCVGSVARALAITDETPAPPFALRAVALAPTEPVRNGLGGGIVYGMK